MAWFTHELFDYLEDLSDNNDRDWFKAERARYEDHLKGPALAFIEELAPRFASISPRVAVTPKALFRIHRDVRFSADKSPYKTHCGLHFRHEGAEGVSSPGFYLHLAPEECFVGMGIYHPDRDSLGKLRERIVADPESWARMEASLRASGFTWGGSSLKRAPRGYDKDHPQIEALRRKDAIVVAPLTPDAVVADDFMDRFVGMCATAAPLVADQCATLGLPW